MGQGRQKFVLTSVCIAECLIGSFQRSDVAEDEYAPNDIAVCIADRCSGIVNRALNSVPGDEDRMVGQPDDTSVLQGSNRRIIDRPASVLINNVKHIGQWQVQSVCLAPAAEL